MHGRKSAREGACGGGVDGGPSSRRRRAPPIESPDSRRAAGGDGTGLAAHASADTYAAAAAAGRGAARGNAACPRLLEEEVEGLPSETEEKNREWRREPSLSTSLFFVFERRHRRAASRSPQIHVRRVRFSAPRGPSFPVLFPPGSTSRSGTSPFAGERRREVQQGAFSVEVSKSSVVVGKVHRPFFFSFSLLCGGGEQVSPDQSAFFGGSFLLSTNVEREESKEPIASENGRWRDRVLVRFPGWGTISSSFFFFSFPLSQPNLFVSPFLAQQLDFFFHWAIPSPPQALPTSARVQMTGDGGQPPKEEAAGATAANEAATGAAMMGAIPIPTTTTTANNTTETRGHGDGPAAAAAPPPPAAPPPAAAPQQQPAAAAAPPTADDIASVLAAAIEASAAKGGGASAKNGAGGDGTGAAALESALAAALAAAKAQPGSSSGVGGGGRRRLGSGRRGRSDAGLLERGSGRLACHRVALLVQRFDDDIENFPVNGNA